MIKRSSLYILFLLAFGATSSAQTNSSSPYSAYGLGLIRDPLLPQNRAMGGISAGLSHIGSYNNINMANPASYADMHMTTFDIGLSGEFSSLQKGPASQPAVFNAALSHIVFGIPVSKKSALSFGLVPYSDLGYTYQRSTLIDTNTVNYIYSGNGGMSKAYLGYGFMLGKHVKAGFNLSYLFGKMEQSSTAEFPNTNVFRNSRTTQSNAVGGLNYDLGAQYSAELNPDTRLTLGYSASTANTIRLTATSLDMLYKSYAGEESGVYDTVSSATVKSKILLPLMQRAGFTIEKGSRWLFGADVSRGSWKNYRVAGADPGLQNNLTFSAGAQLTPDLRTVTNYLKLVDYRAGFRYDKTYLRLSNTDIRDAAITLGLGLPLPSNRGVSFYKINLSTELGQRGTLNNGLVRERYATVYIGITLNDLWFQKFKFD
jgi:hypothetical protein